MNLSDAGSRGSDEHEHLAQEEEQVDAAGLPAEDQLENSDPMEKVPTEQLPEQTGQPAESPDGHAAVPADHKEGGKGGRRTYTPEERQTLLSALKKVYEAGPEHLGEHMDGVCMGCAK